MTVSGVGCGWGRSLVANVHLFVDESKARGYRFALTAVDPQNLNAERSLLRSLLLKGQSHLHFTKESDGQRRKILDALARDSTARTTILTAPDGMKHKAARLRCLQGSAELSIEMRAARLVFEEDASTLQADRQALYRLLHGADIEYRFEKKRQEPLLWISDAIAWCFAAKGEWRKRAEPLVAEARKL